MSSVFQRRHAATLIQFGGQIPQIEGSDYSQGKFYNVNANNFNLIFYLSASSISCRTISSLKYSDVLYRRNDLNRLQVTLITHGSLRQVQELLNDNSISYNIINDSTGKLANRLGINREENRVFLFDKS